MHCLYVQFNTETRLWDDFKWGLPFCSCSLRLPFPQFRALLASSSFHSVLHSTINSSFLLEFLPTCTPCTRESSLGFAISVWMCFLFLILAVKCHYSKWLLLCFPISLCFNVLSRLKIPIKENALFLMEQEITCNDYNSTGNISCNFTS